MDARSYEQRIAQQAKRRFSLRYLAFSLGSSALYLGWFTDSDRWFHLHTSTGALDWRLAARWTVLVVLWVIAYLLDWRFAKRRLAEKRRIADEEFRAYVATSNTDASRSS
jgi:membrane protein implicated in regulation of membrane protease activity